MRILAKAAAAALALSVLSSTASAQPEHWRHERPAEDAIALGSIGAAAGFIIGSAIADSQDRRVDGSWARESPTRVVMPSSRRQAVRGGEPWTRAWFRFCTDRYRSFNPRRGTYVGHDGKVRFCEMPTRQRPGYRFGHGLH